MQQQKSERGDVLVIVLILVLVLAAGAVGYYMWHKNHTKKTVAVVGVPMCDAHDLSLSQGASEGAAGTIYKHAVVTNSSTSTCTLTGYPAVFMVNSGGVSLGSGAAPSISGAPVSLTLTAGGKAHSLIAFPQAGNFDPGVCSDASTSLKMYLPGVVTPLTVAWVDHSCPGFSATAFQPGA